MNPNIPQTDRKRVVIVGAGFGGLKLARKLSGRKEFQVVLLNRQNYHEFQPLYYQVATAGLEANAILFPLRSVFSNCKDVHIRVTNVTGIRPSDKAVDTDLGPVQYDYLVMATGADTNFFNQQNIIEKALPMKSVSEAIALRNRMLQNFEDALSVESVDEKEGFMDVAQLAERQPSKLHVEGSTPFAACPTRGKKSRPAHFGSAGFECVGRFAAPLWQGRGVQIGAYRHRAGEDVPPHRRVALRAVHVHLRAAGAPGCRPRRGSRRGRRRRCSSAACSGGG